jgi:hypothetical protein
MQEREHDPTRAEENDGLHDARPNDRAHPAKSDEENRHDRKGDDAPDQWNVEDRRHRERRDVEPDARSQQARDEEEPRRAVLRARAKSHEQEFINRSASRREKRRDEKVCNHHPRERRADEELRIVPIAAIRIRWHPDDGHRADLGRDERQTRRPTGDVPPAEEESLGRFLAPASQPSDEQHNRDDQADDENVRPG